MHMGKNNIPDIGYIALRFTKSLSYVKAAIKKVFIVNKKARTVLADIGDTSRRAYKF
jgi:hypothetical protein